MIILRLAGSPGRSHLADEVAAVYKLSGEEGMPLSVFLGIAWLLFDD